MKRLIFIKSEIAGRPHKTMNSFHFQSVCRFIIFLHHVLATILSNEIPLCMMCTVALKIELESLQ